MTQFLAKVWADPFQYAIGAIMVVMAAGWVIRYVKDEFLS